MPRTRETNQYYSKYFEQAVTAAINEEEINYDGIYKDFTNYEIVEMKKDALILKNYLKEKNVSHIGNQTFKKTGDILLSNGKSLELKYIAGDSRGTYHNASLNYLKKFGFNYKDYMKEAGLFDILKNSFGTEFSFKENDDSPFSRTDASKIMKKYKNIYKEKIVPLDKQWREKFTKDIVNYLKNNPQDVAKILHDAINKDMGIANKTMPDRLIAFNYITKNINEMDMKKLKDKEKEVVEIKSSKLGFTINNIRFAISWQNGSGLNNPSLRIFV